MMMRRRERQITDAGAIDSIITECTCMRLGMMDEEGVYIVPLSFGYETKEADGTYNDEVQRTFYFHGAREGRKARCIDKGGDEGVAVSFEMDCGYALKTADIACKHSAYYKSVMGTGIVQLVEDSEAKKHALNLIMEHTAGKGGWDFPVAMLSHVAVWRLAVTSISCKANEPSG